MPSRSLADVASKKRHAMTDSQDRPDAGRGPARAVGAPRRSHSPESGSSSRASGLSAPAIIALWPNPLQPWSNSNALAAYAPAMLVSIMSGGAVVVGSVAAYVILARAGFPRRSRADDLRHDRPRRRLPLVAVARFGYVLGSALWTVAAVLPVIGCALLLVFAISAARNRVLPLGFRIVPAVQFVLAVLAYFVHMRTSFPIDTAASGSSGSARPISSSPRGADAAARASWESRRLPSQVMRRQYSGRDAAASAYRRLHGRPHPADPRSLPARRRAPTPPRGSGTTCAPPRTTSGSST